MLLFDDLVRASSFLSAAICKDGNISNARRRLSAISLQSGVNWVSQENPLFPKSHRLAGAYASHDPTISGWNGRFAPEAASRNFARGAA
jgi:hypothetical protein